MKSSGIIRLVAGGYLIYLSIKIINGGLLSGEMTGRNRVVGILFSAAFIVVAIYAILSALRGIRKDMEERDVTTEEPQDYVATADAEEVADAEGAVVEEVTAEGTAADASPAEPAADETAAEEDSDAEEEPAVYSGPRSLFDRANVNAGEIGGFSYDEDGYLEESELK